MQAQIQDGGLNQFIWDFVINPTPLKFPLDDPYVIPMSAMQEEWSPNRLRGFHSQNGL